MPYHFPRCQILPLPDDQVSIEIDGRERLRWHFNRDLLRPFFYPLIGPSGTSLVRISHPVLPDHDHHRGIWFGHADLMGIDFWSMAATGRIRQRQWFVMQDGDDEAILAVWLDWVGPDGQTLVQQEMIAVVRPGEDDELFVELNSTFQPPGEWVEFKQSNFGVLALRVAKSLSKRSGGGEVVNSAGQHGEKEVFGLPATWMDYSGPVPSGDSEGITYFDHPANPEYPEKWHVRDDGWMGASLSREGAVRIVDHPLVVRYLLHAHRGPVDPQRADEIARQFAARPGYRVAPPFVVDRRYTIERTD